MTLRRLRWFVTRHPLPVVIFWIVLTIWLVVVSPNLTKLAAEGQANLLPKFAESSVAAALCTKKGANQARVVLDICRQPEGTRQCSPHGNQSCL